MILEIGDPKTYRGDPVFELQVGDPIPTARSGPFALLVTPVLAEYFLTLNHSNRLPKMKRAQYAGDMRSGLWRYPAEAIHFTEDGLLGNGQNRLYAVTWAKVDVWFRVEFGWPKASLDAMDQGSARGAPDVLRLHGIPDPYSVAAAVTIVVRYDETAGTARSWMNSNENNYVPSGVQAEVIYAQDETLWLESIHRGGKIHAALDNGLTRSVWAAAYYICARKLPGAADTFFRAVAEGDPTIPAALALRDHAMRRSLKTYRTGDRREPLENIMRAFRAYLRGEVPHFVRRPGFALTPLK